MPERREFRIGGTVVVLLLVASYLFATNRGQEAVLRARLDAERLAAQRDSIAVVVENVTRAQERLRRERDADSLQTLVVVLQDSIAALERETSRVLQAGYAQAFTDYRQLTDRYVAEVQKPRLSLGASLGLCLGAAGAGVLLGTAVVR